MKNNKIYTNDELINLNKPKMMFIGFIIGILPFVILIITLSIYEGGINFIPKILKETLIICGIITAIINSITLSGMYIAKVKMR